MKTLDRATLKRFVDLAATHLKGDWLLMGGTVLPVLGQSVRATVDIDLVKLGGKGLNDETLQLMKLAESIGIAPETINQAGALFLSRIKHLKKDLVILKVGKKGKIYRPGATLYLLLKIGRMSESDFADCTHWIKYCSEKGESIERERVINAIKEALSVSSEDASKRLLKLQSLVSS